jgi:hypothetical protein
MRQAEIVVGRRYFATVNGDLVIVRITGRTPYKRGRLDVFEAESLKTGRRVRLTAARILARVAELYDKEVVDDEYENVL